MFEGIVVRHAVLEDLDGIINVELAAWGEAGAATTEMIESRIGVYPSGNLVALSENEVIGFGTMLRTNLDFQHKNFTWQEASGNGFIESVYAPDGEVFYGVDLSISPKWQARGLGEFMIAHIREVGRKQGCLWMIAGGRMPGYDSYCKKHGDIPADEYVLMKNLKGEALDPQIRFYVDRVGFKAVRSLPEYFIDPESRNYGVLLAINLKEW